MGLSCRFNRVLVRLHESGRNGFNGAYGGWSISLGVGVRAKEFSEILELHRWYSKFWQTIVSHS